MARKTKEEAEQTRKKLLETAALLFWEKGVSQTSLADIASSAGLTRGAIYWHFKDKLDLFYAMSQQVVPPYHQIYDSMERNAADNAARSLWCGSLEILTTVSQSPDIRRILGILFFRCEYVGELQSLQIENLDWIRQLQQRLICIIELAQQQGQLKPGIDPVAAAIAWQAQLRGLVQFSLLLPDTPLLHSLPDSLLKPYFSGVFKPDCWLAHD
ncbi:TetR family transcriptional regulator [Rhodobacteraceae bacterium CH30]|nr:TetR family transcriptional regulator [Rhodobacteraceae bacterium CH30]